MDYAPWIFRDWLNYFACILRGHPGPRQLSVVVDKSAPNGRRYAMVCERCKTCEPLTPKQRAFRAAISKA